MTSAASRPPLPGRHELVGDAMEAAAVAPPPLIDYAIAYAAIVRVCAVASGAEPAPRSPRGHSNLRVRAAGARVRRRTRTAGWLAGSHGAVDATRARGCAELLAEALDAMTEWIAAA